MPEQTMFHRIRLTQLATGRGEARSWPFIVSVPYSEVETITSFSYQITAFRQCHISARDSLCDNAASCTRTAHATLSSARCRRGAYLNYLIRLVDATPTNSIYFCDSHGSLMYRNSIMLLSQSGAIDMNFKTIRIWLS